MLWFNFVAVSVDFLQSGIARFFSSGLQVHQYLFFFFLTDNFNKNSIISSFHEAFNRYLLIIR